MKTKRPLLYFFCVLIGSALILPACAQQHEKNTQEQESPKSMDSTQTSPKAAAKPAEKNLDKMLSGLKESMISYLKSAEPPYTMDDIDSCEKILKAYIVAINASKSKEQGMEIVKTTVLNLNKLNGKTEESLIETSEREQIAEIIVLAASRKGYNTVDEDITEEWREW
ncbi:hypothetical protein [Pedobacter miscanthi]|uniref:Lipoprotein n=1 Tax=Pedobacter miscanthi TaxID=2259170 RepID=A0A366LE95_9SPHI|nr:hypothetical protein [Pedobacter miscanthi]RBQ11472.1 hypothetical protein DRW42_03135 [Pedobacter miscanthi]